MDSESQREESPSAPPQEREGAEESWWQWVALVVLLACWLAEASF